VALRATKRALLALNFNPGFGPTSSARSQIGTPSRPLWQGAALSGPSGPPFRPRVRPHVFGLVPNKNLFAPTLTGGPAPPPPPPSPGRAGQLARKKCCSIDQPTNRTSKPVATGERAGQYFRKLPTFQGLRPHKSLYKFRRNRTSKHRTLADTGYTRQLVYHSLPYILPCFFLTV
jgi:hypothetical protein